MIQEAELSNLLYFDLETSSEYSTFEELAEMNPRKADLWKVKHDKAVIKDPERWSMTYEESYKMHTPLSAEFGRIVCASFCHLMTTSEDGKMVWYGKMKSFYDNVATEISEKQKVLLPVSTLMFNLDRAGKNMRLCGHNIKKFDIPWLAKRMMMKNVDIPPQLQLWGKKPWEVTHLDTGEMWSFGNWDGYVSLDLLSSSLDIPSPKENMKGEYVGRYFHDHKKYIEIKDYCEEDVKCVARICHKWSGSILPIQF